MQEVTTFIGFGEAGQAFASSDWPDTVRAFDVKSGEAASRAAKLDDYVRSGIDGRESLSDALDGAGLILSLVTADSALQVAEDAARTIAPGAIFCDMNSIAPQTKQAAARVIEAAGAHYVDVAVMAPVHPARRNVPLLLSGALAAEAQRRLAALGFTNQRVVGDAVGRASAIKMVRSVMVKGMEALTAECVLAAEAAGVLDEVMASLDASEKPRPWAERADYNLDRMMIHGVRRAAEMDEVVKTLDALGTGSAMTRGTVERQRTIGTMGLAEPSDTLETKIAQIRAGATK